MKITIMTTLQEYLNEKYPTPKDKARVENINIDEENSLPEIEGGELILGTEYNNLKEVIIIGFFLIIEEYYFDFYLTNLTFNCPNLTKLQCHGNQLTTLDFLSSLPHPEKLTKLTIYNNNIQPIDIAVFAPFVNFRIFENRNYG